MTIERERIEITHGERMRRGFGRRSADARADEAARILSGDD